MKTSKSSAESVELVKAEVVEVGSPALVVGVPVKRTKHVVEMSLSTLSELAQAAAGGEAELRKEGSPRGVGPFFIRCSDGFLLVLCVAGRGGIEYRVPLPFNEETIARYDELGRAWEASSRLKRLRSMEEESKILDARWDPFSVVARRRKWDY